MVKAEIDVGWMFPSRDAGSLNDSQSRDWNPGHEAGTQYTVQENEQCGNNKHWKQCPGREWVRGRNTVYVQCFSCSLKAPWCWGWKHPIKKTMKCNKRKTVLCCSVVAHNHNSMQYGLYFNSCWLWHSAITLLAEVRPASVQQSENLIGLVNRIIMWSIVVSMN